MFNCIKRTSTIIKYVINYSNKINSSFLEYDLKSDIALNIGNIAAADKMIMQMLRERLTACVAVNGGHCEHLQSFCPSSLSTENNGFLESPTYYRRKQDLKLRKLKINFSQGSAAALCRSDGRNQ